MSASVRSVAAVLLEKVRPGAGGFRGGSREMMNPFLWIKNRWQVARWLPFPFPPLTRTVNHVVVLEAESPGNADCVRGSEERPPPGVT